MAANFGVAKRKHQEFKKAVGLKHVSVSLCNTSAEQRHLTLEESIATTTKSARDAQNILALSRLLDELIARSCMRFQEAFEEFAAITETIDKVKARQQFKDRILSKHGLPVIIVSNAGQMFVMLLEMPLNNIKLCCSLDRVLDAAREDSSCNSFPNALAASIPTLMKLMSNARDRAILTYVLANIFSPTTLSLVLGMQQQRLKNIVDEVTRFSSNVEAQERNGEIEAERHLDKVITKIEKDLENSESLLKRKRARLDEAEIESREFDIGVKRARLESLYEKPVKVKKRISKRIFSTWKGTLMSQKGKGKGVYSIDRGAEQAISELLHEQLKAHRRRWGEEDTGYLDYEKRIQSKEMRQIANQYLVKHGKKPVKSKATVRSWGKCRNKRYRQAQQHRGCNLWAHLRTQKKHRERHVNVHYNRAHIKNYTRFAFGTHDGADKKGLVIRRAIDDKAYVRCGTSEGFSRPLHTPTQLTGDDNQVTLPSSDYPDTVGYVSPGVVLMVNDMKELQHKGRDKFVPTDLSIGVICKPKHVYPSTATNWANDLFSIRYTFRSEHEVPMNSVADANANFLPDEALPYLIGVRDSIFQFELMSLKDDYERVVEGGDHLSREQLRVTVLLKRLDICMTSVAAYERYPLTGKLTKDLELLKEQLEKIGAMLSDNKGQDYCDISSYYESACELCRGIRHRLEENGLPNHRPFDIQTSDAGPGVASHEQMTQLRMAEYFMINCLDLQSRFHYAPNDSASHIAEKVMRSLNECLGDGRSIPVPFLPLCDDQGRIKLKDISNEQLKNLQAEKERDTAIECARVIKNRFDGKSSMGTSIHASTPCYESHLQFFFDEKFMIKCASASSETVLEKCAGKEYYKFVRDFFRDHYFLFDNGFEGIRNGCRNSGKVCEYHARYENPSLLTNGFRGVPVTRVQPPVPDYSFTGGEFHYAFPQQISSGELTAKFDLNKDELRNAATRKIDEFCPRAQLNHYMQSYGTPDLQMAEVHPQESLSVTVVDRNDVLGKMLSNVDYFVQTYTGEDLRTSVVKEIKRRHNAMVKAFIVKKTNASTRAAEKARTYDDFDWEKLIQTSQLTGLYVSQLDLYLIKNLKLPKSQCEKKGFTKEKKIEAIKKHYYASTGPPISGASVGSPSVPRTSNNKSQELTNTVVVTLPDSLKNEFASNMLNVPPWGGKINLPYIGQITLVNTCPIDNFLTIFYTLMKNHRKAFQEISSSVEVYASYLIKIYKLFDRGNFVEGKLEWLKLFPGRFQTTPLIDLWGNEEDLFVSRLYSSSQTTFISTCDSSACPVRVKQCHANAIALSHVGFPVPAFLEESLRQWMNTDQQQSTCGLTMHHVPPGANYFISNCYVQDPGTGQLIQTPKAYCGGLRSNTRRAFVRGNPPFLLLSLDIFARQGTITDVTHLPQIIQVSSDSYSLFGLTFWNGNHYRGAVTIQDQWHYYDGMWERQCQGHGLKKCVNKPSTPAGFYISHSVYVKISLL